MATIFRPPLITRQPPRSSFVAIHAQAMVGTALLLTTLAGQDNLPTGRGMTADQPNPRGPVHAIALRTHTQGLVLTTLAGQDAFFHGAGRGPVYDYPNPIRSVFPTRLLSFAVVLGTSDPGTPTPAVDSPNPRGPVFPVSLRTHTQALTTGTLAGQDQVYLAPGMVRAFDWQHPRGPAFPTELRTWLQSPSLGLLQGAPTFFGEQGQSKVYDYPNPRGPVHPIGLRTHTQSLVTGTLAGQDALYGAAGEVQAYDYPNPRGPVFSRELLTWAPPVSVALLTFTPTPVVPIDWPNPSLGRPFPIALRTHLHATPLNLIGQDALVRGVGMAPVVDFPNPILRIRTEFGQSEIGLALHTADVVAFMRVTFTGRGPGVTFTARGAE